MKTVAGRIVVAVLLFVGAAGALSQARQTRQVAEAHRRLATLQYDRGNGTDEAAADAPAFMGLVRDEGLEQRATVAYWRSEYDMLSDPAALAGAAGPQAAADPGVLFVAANASFRLSQMREADLARSIERLDRVVQAYADVLRANPGHEDAAFNYEYVARFRDTLARTKGKARRAELPFEVIPSADLPVGPTLHGLPGGPPPEIPGSDFKTIAPMPYDEREETEPGAGPAPRRRG